MKECVTHHKEGLSTDPGVLHPCHLSIQEAEAEGARLREQPGSKQNRTPGIMVNNCNPSTQKVEGGDQNFEVSLGYTMNKYSK